jgi:glycine/D-amino acid oxidase-like deaminating enzyme
MPNQRIVIAGAGIIGASIAYHLAKRGAEVIVLDAAEPGAGATGKSLGWINATFSKRPREYFDLNLAGIAGWRRLQLELQGELKVQWGGSVAWFPPGLEAEELRLNVLKHQEWGYAVHIVDERELHRWLPAVEPGEFAAGCYSEDEGSVDPLEALTVLLKNARQFGAEVHPGCEVTGFGLAGDLVKSIQTCAGSFEANAFVLACGVGTSRLAQLAGVHVPLKDSPGVLVHTAPAARLMDCVVLAPGTHFKQGLDGRIVVGGPIVAGVGTAITEASIEQAEEIRRLAEQFLPQLKGVAVDRVTLGYRVMPRDEYPIVGFADVCPNLYVAATHSGVTLAPLIGQLAAMEILDGVRVQMFEPYRLSRFSRLQA